VRKTVVLLHLFAGLSAVASNAQSKPVVVHFQGTVVRVTNAYARLPATVTVGAPVYGSFRYELEGVTVAQPYWGYALYTIRDAGLHISVDIGPMHWHATNPTAGSTDVEIENDPDIFRISAGTARSFPFRFGTVGMDVTILDYSAPYEMVDRIALPITNRDIAWANANSKSGSVWSQTGGYWGISYEISKIEFVTSSVERDTWSGIKSMYR